MFYALLFFLVFVCLGGLDYWTWIAIVLCEMGADFVGQLLLFYDVVKVMVIWCDHAMQW